MITQYFKCTLLDDVILMASLATEGNMTSLDYIPGSNFLGMVANEIYKDGTLNPYDILHTNKVVFSDATLSIDDQKTYPIPFDFMVDKLDDEITPDTEIHLHHTINDGEIKKNESRIQLKQLRAGYFTFKEKYQKVKKSFSLKSAYDSEKLKSEDEKMYGMEAIKAGQEFIFSVSSEEENILEKIKSLLTSNPKFLGKSKNAQFGKIKIIAIDKKDVISSFETKGYVLVYAASNLIIFDKYGQITLRPEASDLGISSGEINWNKSSIRTGSYSSWNGKRNMPNTERFYISKGSVFYIEGSNSVGDKTENIVGEYQNEGFGSILYNPIFLEPMEKNENDPNTEYMTKFRLNPVTENKDIHEEKPLTGNDNDKPLLCLLNSKLEKSMFEKDIAEQVNITVTKWSKEKSDVTRTQWNNIRNAAQNSRTIAEFRTKIENETNGIMTCGKYMESWQVYKGKMLEEIKNKDKNWLPYFAKLAAEMSKKAKSN